jgi:hypothetical protein
MPSHRFKYPHPLSPYKVIVWNIECFVSSYEFIMYSHGFKKINIFQWVLKICSFNQNKVIGKWMQRNEKSELLSKCKFCSMPKYCHK